MRNTPTTRGVGRIRKTISANYEVADKTAAITDILTDLRHYCTRYKLDFANLDRIARGHYTEEKEGTK